MADYAAPSGPPPPRVPDGWKAVWNDQYQEWFYVNLSTKASQWEMPTEPAYAPPGDGPPPGGPPSYDHNTAQHVGAEKSNNPFANTTGGSAGAPAAYGATGGATGLQTQNVQTDEQMARDLQAQEDARAQQTQSRGSYGAPSQPNYGDSSNLPPREEKKKGLLSKLGSKLSGSSSSSGYPQQQRYGYGAPQGYGGGHYPPQQYGQYPPQPGYGGYGQQPYGGAPYGHGYGPPMGGYHGGGYPPRRQGGGGMGMAGGMALGAGAGLLGGALIAESFDDDGGGGDDGGGDDGGE